MGADGVSDDREVGIALVVGLVVFEYLVSGEGKGSLERDGEVLRKGLGVVDREVEAPVVDNAQVAVDHRLHVQPLARRVESEHVGDVLPFEEDVAALLLKEVGRDVQTSLEEPQIDARIPLFTHLPLDVGVGETLVVGTLAIVVLVAAGRVAQTGILQHDV